MEWYARAVGALSLLPLTARTSWRYLGAIHGIQAGQAGPPTPEHSRMWNQCQHGGWYFLPWHRGYVAAFEAVLAKTIVDLGGPVDWALPYWNYLDATNPASRDIPRAFTDPTLPDGTPNPLAQAPRHGVSRLGPTPWLPTDITLAAMNEPDYTSAAGTTGFGGGTTAFLHFGNLTGTVEANPHNLVHVMVGGVGPNAGYMSDPDLAALDPIFWVHHCNIDRLWAAWLTVPTNRMENGPTWRAGPSPRQFAMPDKDGSNLVVFTPAQTIPGGSLAPVYDDLTKGTGVPTVVASVSTRTAMPAGVQPAPAPATLFGSNTEVVEVGASPATTTVHLATRRAQAVAAAGVVRERVFLNLENVRGAAPSGVLSVSVTAPSRGTVPSSAPAVEDTIALFGLAKASASDAGHGGNGLSFAIDITGLANTVAADDLDRLEVQIRQPGEAGDSPITVDRVSVFRQPVR